MVRTPLFRAAGRSGPDVSRAERAKFFWRFCNVFLWKFGAKPHTVPDLGLKSQPWCGGLQPWSWPSARGSSLQSPPVPAFGRRLQSQSRPSAGNSSPQSPSVPLMNVKSPSPTCSRHAETCLEAQTRPIIASQLLSCSHLAMCMPSGHLLSIF